MGNGGLNFVAAQLSRFTVSSTVSARRIDLSTYRNVPKFSDRQVWAESGDPDQTALRGAV